MNKIKLFRLLLILKKYAHQGISLTELLVALVISGIVLTGAVSGFINLLTANQDVESKTSRSVALEKALSYMQNDIKGAVSITREPNNTNCNSTAIDSQNCLVLTYSNGVEIDGDTCSKNPPKIYYGYEDIKDGLQIWLKPGTLKRKVVCTNVGNWQVIADGLISVNENNPRTDFDSDKNFCSQDDVNWTSGNLYGDNGSGKGGFRFCLDDNTTTNRLVRIFLYGHIVGGNDNNMISANTITFARAE